MSENKTFVPLIPTWEAACSIYMMALDNPKCPEDTKREARADILNLAKAYDKLAPRSKQYRLALENIVNEGGPNSEIAAQALQEKTE